MPSERIDYLDAVRSFALLLGVVFHASLSFMPIYIGWAVMDISTSPLISIFALISHAFRMELFFLVAGFFTALSLHKLSLKAFLGARIMRIGLPFVIGWILLRPLLVSGWVIGGQSMQGVIDVNSAISQGFDITFGGDTAWFTGTHLWFLYYLLLFSAGAVVVTALEPFIARIVVKISDGFGRILLQRWSIFVLAGLLTLPLWFMQRWGVDTPDQSLVPHVPVTLVYLAFFVGGWQLWRQPHLLMSLTLLTPTKLLVMLVSVGVCVFLAEYESQSGHAYYAPLKWLFSYSYAVMMLVLIAITIGLCRHFFSRPHPAVRYVANASYWLYLIHLPLVVMLQVTVAEWPLHWSFKWLGVSITTIALGLLSYQLFVRSTPLGWVLDGKARIKLK